MSDFQVQIPISAPVDVCWLVMSDVERWHEWTPSISRIEVMDGKALRQGAKVRIIQPKIKSYEWTVTEWEEGRSFTWESASWGLQLLASHTLIPQADGRCLADLRLSFRGPIAGFITVLGGKLTREYMQMEADGLKKRCEERKKVR